MNFFNMISMLFFNSWKYLFIYSLVCYLVFSICPIFCFLFWISFWMSHRLPWLLLHFSIALNFFFFGHAPPLLSLPLPALPPHNTHRAWGILIPRPGVKPMSAVVEAQSLNHWTAKKDPAFSFYLHHFHLISSQSTDILLCSQQHPQPVLDSEQLLDKYLSCAWVNERIFSSLIFMLYILEFFF